MYLFVFSRFITLFLIIWAVFIKNAGFTASLEARNLYTVEGNPKAQTPDMIRMVSSG